MRTEFERRGFSEGGGIWGAAMWRRLGDKVVISVNDESMGVPTDPAEPVVLYIYSGEHMADWRPGRDAEAPEICDARQIDFESATAALAFIDAVFPMIAD